MTFVEAVSAVLSNPNLGKSFLTAGVRLMLGDFKLSIIENR